MTRVRIIGDSRTQERAVADLLAQDERIEIVDSPAAFSDVCVVIGHARRAPVESLVVLLSDHAAPSFDAQLRAWLPLNVSAEELATAILAAAQDLTVLTREQAQRRLPDSARLAADENAYIPEELTQRERQVLRMMADGLANKEIAGKLGISDHTAKFHVAQILAKLGAATRTEAVTIAIRRGLVPI
ncbi:MAG TPA: response regulator transcription factor [Bryobacteraceae bacterium]|jgi:DNA-binding NarL/FixJ family response regulator|nr:response regulator transcription factor [Bryobacteraceae bacterium]